MVAPAMRSLQPTERNDQNYSSFKLELLALKWAVTEKFKDYLYGAEFTVYTDNNPLVHLETARLGAVEQRWVAQLSNFRYTSKYRPGLQNRNADVLSRLAERQEGTPVQDVRVTYVEVETWAEQQAQDPDLVQLRHWKEQAATKPEVCPIMSRYMRGLLREWDKIVFQDGLLGRVWEEAGVDSSVLQVVVPIKEAREVWKRYHEEMGHPSSDRTMAIIQQRCYWPGMTQDVKNWTDSCPQCVYSKAGPDGRAPLLPIHTSYPFEVVGMDYLSLGRPEDRYPYILVMTDLFSKYAIAVPTRDQSSETTARALYNNLILTFGCPERILTDRGGAFESSLMNQLCQIYGCMKSRTTSYHPQGNGACERFNQTLLQLLNSLSEVQQTQWPHQLPALVQAYNNTGHSTTGMTPHYVVFGRHARLPVDWVLGLGPRSERYTMEGWVKAHQKALHRAFEQAQQRTQHRRGRDVTRYDRRARLPPLLPGERVLVRNFRRRAHGKLAPRWRREPHVIVRGLCDNHPVYIVRPEGKAGPTHTVHRNNLRPCPLTILQEPIPAEIGVTQPLEPQNQLPPPTCWLPGLIVTRSVNPRASELIPQSDGLHQNPPEPPVRRSLRPNLGRPPTRFSE